MSAPKTRRVYVFRHEYDAVGGGTKAYTLLYLTYQGEGACIHDVEAVTGPDAKAKAGREHRDKCGNRGTSF